MWLSRQCCVRKQNNGMYEFVCLGSTKAVFIVPGRPQVDLR